MAKTATDEQFAQLRSMSAAYEQATGQQGYLYCTQPSTTEQFVFGDGGVVSGIDKALERQRQLCEQAEVAL